MNNPFGKVIKNGNQSLNWLLPLRPFPREGIISMNYDRYYNRSSPSSLLAPLVLSSMPPSLYFFFLLIPWETLHLPKNFRGRFFSRHFPRTVIYKILIWRPYHILPFQIYTFFPLFYAMENQYRIHSTSHAPSLHTILSGIFFTPAFLPHAAFLFFLYFFGSPSLIPHPLRFSPAPFYSECPRSLLLSIYPPTPCHRVWSGSLSSSGC